MLYHSGMKCAACGYDGRTFKDPNTGHLHAQSGVAFEPVVLRVHDGPDVRLMQASNLFSCPRCGTVRVESELG